MAKCAMTDAQADELMGQDEVLAFLNTNGMTPELISLSEQIPKVYPSEEIPDFLSLAEENLETMTVGQAVFYDFAELPE